MNKLRIESLSDCVFSIVMTILMIDIKVPSLVSSVSEYELMGRLLDLWPAFRSYYISFAILGMYWLAHHTMFHLIVKHVDRSITYLNILFLCFISLLPFSTHLIALYPLNTLAVAVYGSNVIVVGCVQYAMFRVAVRNPQMLHEGVTEQQIVHSTVRMLVPPIFAVAGIFAGFYHSSISFFLFALPVIFNIVPESLNFVDNMFLKKK